MNTPFQHVRLLREREKVFKQQYLNWFLKTDYLLDCSAECHHNLITEQDPLGVFITSLELKRIEANSGDTQGYLFNPGLAGEVKVLLLRKVTNELKTCIQN